MKTDRYCGNSTCATKTCDKPPPIILACENPAYARIGGKIGKDAEVCWIYYEKERKQLEKKKVACSTKPDER